MILHFPCTTCNPPHSILWTQAQFQLVERRSTPFRSDQAAVGCATLRAACHLIPYLDNFLQLFLEDLGMLRLPTLVREA